MREKGRRTTRATARASTRAIKRARARERTPAPSPARTRARTAAAAVAASTLALALVLAGCGGDSTAADGRVEITVWHTESTPTTVAALDEIIADYEAANPGVTVNQESVGWGDLQVKFQAALAAGDLPEITQVEPMFVRTLYSQDLLVPLDDVVDSLGDDYLPQLRDMFALPDGHDYGVVHAWGTDSVVYRADLYANAPGAGTPEDLKTWDDSVEQWKAVSEANDDAYGLMLAGDAAHNVNEEVYLWLGSNGGHLFDENGHVTIDTPQMREVLEYWVELRDSGALSPAWSSQTYADSLSSLALGEAATIFSFGRATYTFEDQAPELVPGEDIKVAPNRPVGPSGDDWITQLDAEPWVVFKDSPDAEAAADFLEFFFERQNYLRWIGSVPTQLLPVRASTFDDADYRALPEVRTWEFWIDQQRQMLESGQAYPLMVTQWSDLELPYVSDLYGSEILVDMVMDVVENGKDIDEAMDDAQARADELLSPLYDD
ncbi:ABC transporter substrate-binding protein [Jiangella sp. DSM 45060]|uniref:ABC transporter substrate-binding protein n=1 Tax=Jiangella sp. DSM 45060 TaxID=1798224 RepID=UPI00087C704D|nr:sugar ABC transporter substrate-binding protein [Jiangella sp. DSM 45060]SDT23221.1 ABC-type glycerol-3-phosphate transport system, substrate-binding protein [Jiangella sp. DSM 45060]